jgi:hypothetical protein
MSMVAANIKGHSKEPWTGANFGLDATVLVLLVPTFRPFQFLRVLL